jgi:hypothetical protein
MSQAPAHQSLGSQFPLITNGPDKGKVISDLGGMHPMITKHRDTGNGYYISMRRYPTQDVEAVAIKLSHEDSLRRGGGAKRKNNEKSEMDDDTLKKSIQRARTTVRRKLLSLCADRLLTLTFHENVTNDQVAWDRFKYFNKLMRFRYGDKWAYVAVPEYQKRGAVHFHLAIVGYYHANTVRRLWRRACGKLGGNVDITSPRKAEKNSWNPKRIANYLSKYITKTETADFNARRFSSGGKIQIPPAVTGWMACGGSTSSALWDVAQQLTHKPVREYWESEGYFDLIMIST